MKNKIGSVVFMLLGVMTEAQVENSIRRVDGAVEIELELEKIPNVKTYDIEVKKMPDKFGKLDNLDKNKKNKEILLRFSQQEPLFKIKLQVGGYLVRTRMSSNQSETSAWSEWSELLARPEEVSLLEVSKYNFTINKNQMFTRVNLKWQQAVGADKYIIFVEDQMHKTTTLYNAKTNNVNLNLKAGEYKIGVQSISKNRIRSQIKYFENSFFVAKTQLPVLPLTRVDLNSFRWPKRSETNVRIDIYRKAFFAEKYLRIESFTESSENWHLPKSLPPGEYKIDFQYVSDIFVNGPVQSVSFLKKPNENDFANAHALLSLN